MNPELVLSTITAIALGVGLSAAVGFRIFVPFTVMSVAALTGNLNLTSGFDWIGTWPALVLFATATALEIGAYYIPWLDNALDTLATPAAVVAGAVITASVVGDISPMLRWVLAIIAGGGVAGAVQTGTTLLRAGSTATTGGVGNPVINTAEITSSFTLSIVTVVLPLFALAVVISFFAWAWRRIVRRGRQTPDGVSPG
jgi:hypothetical protein